MEEPNSQKKGSGKREKGMEDPQIKNKKTVPLIRCFIDLS